MDWQSFTKPEFIWIAVGLFLMLLEMAIPGLLIIFFGFGAVVTGVVCLFADISLNIQLLTFVITSVGSLLLLRNQLKKIFLGKESTEGNPEFENTEYQGRKAVTKQDIAAGETGKVEFQGSDWNAISKEDLKQGETVTIIGQDGLTFIVKR